MTRTIVLNRDIKIVLEQLSYSYKLHSLSELILIATQVVQMAVSYCAFVYVSTWYPTGTQLHVPGCKQMETNLMSTASRLLQCKPETPETETAYKSGSELAETPEQDRLLVPGTLPLNESVSFWLSSLLRAARQLPGRKWSRCDNGSLSQLPSSLAAIKLSHPISSIFTFLLFHLLIQSLTLSFSIFNLPIAKLNM
jgi:hypothetical protein